MGMFLNGDVFFEKFRKLYGGTYFVDKSMLLGELFPFIGDENCYFCITRPRRFGKTVMANMAASFFCRSVDSRELFDSMEISRHAGYHAHLNGHNVIYIDFSEVPENCASYQSYHQRIVDGLKNDLVNGFPEMKLDRKQAVWDMLTTIFSRSKERFIFVMDEWDAVFHMPFITKEDTVSYLLFLKSLLKSKAYVELAYMTGILPIAKYSDGSELNMFVEFQMTTMEKFSGYFGFTDGEVDELYGRYQTVEKNPVVSREKLREWYDGYDTIAGVRLYNPRSVVLALTYNQLASYWTSSGTYDSVYYYIRNNIAAVRDDLALMLSGTPVSARIQEYAASAMELSTRDQIYSAMVVFGLLTYRQGQVSIPNKELMKKFEELVYNKESLGYVYRLAKESERMLEATLEGNSRVMEEILQFAHDTETPLLAYNHEAELAAVVNLVYLAARDRYRVEREDKGGRGFVDFIFYPENPEADAIILELKVGHTPEYAIRQIREKKYELALRGRLGEKRKFNGRVLAVGIGYNKKKKMHRCKVEVL